MAGFGFPDFTPMLPEFLGGAPAQPPRVGGVAIGGSCPGLFHTTASGRRSPNTISFVQDDSGRTAFFVYAGRPTHFSKIGRYPRRRRRPR